MVGLFQQHNYSDMKNVKGIVRQRRTKHQLVSTQVLSELGIDLKIPTNCALLKQTRVHEANYAVLLLERRHTRERA